MIAVPTIVIPAHAGIHLAATAKADKWIPAFAGMTKENRAHSGVNRFQRFLAAAGLFVFGLLAGCAAEPQFLSAPEITAELMDHTAYLPGGFVEYYASDGAVRGVSDGQPYSGTWRIERDAFCTALSGDPPVCSRVARAGTALMWSPDGDKAPSRIDKVLPGNPEHL